MATDRAFTCKKCKNTHHPSLYAIAQLAQGNSIVFTCGCGEKTTLTPNTKPKKAQPQ